MWHENNWKHWRLVAKLDPDKITGGETLCAINHPGFDAVVVGGTQGITFNKTVRLIEKIRLSGYVGPLVQEISHPEVVVPGVDAHFIPLVLNAGHKQWFCDYHFEALKKYGGLINWETVLTEGYLVCNPGSAVGKLTGTGVVQAADAVAYTLLAEGIYNLPLLYIEYSGVLGDVSLVREVSRCRRGIHLFYGGGITGVEQAVTMGSMADTIVVGDILHADPLRALEIAEFNHVEKKGRGIPFPGSPGRL